MDVDVGFPFPQVFRRVSFIEGDLPSKVSMGYQMLVLFGSNMW